MFNGKISQEMGISVVENINNTEIKKLAENASPLMQILLAAYVLDSAASEFRQKALEHCAKYNKGIIPNDCKTLINVLQEMGDWPETFSSPLSIYNMLQRRKAGSKKHKWTIETIDGIKYIKNSETDEKIPSIHFDAILSLCRNLSKTLSRKTCLERDKRQEVSRYIRDISKAVLRGDSDECEQLQAGLSIAVKQSKNVVEWTEAENDSIEKALNAIPVIKTRKKDSEEQIRARAERAEAEAAKARAEAEAAKARAEAEAEAKARAEAEAETAREARKAWENERKKLAEHNAKTHARMQDAANKYNNLLILLKTIPKDCSNLKKKDMQDFLEHIAKQIA